MAPKKRRPGGGRKPQGGIYGNLAPLSLRVTPAVRDGIEKAAKKNKLSLSQETQERLALSLKFDRKVPRFRHLMFLVGTVAQAIEAKTGESWVDDAYTAQMLCGAVDTLIRELGAKGETIVPTSISKEADRQRAEGLNPSIDPREVGAGEAQFILAQIRARTLSTRTFNATFNPDAPAKDWRWWSWSEFDALIEELDL
jgi:hypothetical protein